VGPRLIGRTMRALVERVSAAPADCLEALVAESEQQGFGFVRRLVEEWSAGTNRFDRPGEVLFVARVRGDVVGVCGLSVDPYAGDPAVGRVRHLYVLVSHRRSGIGEQLVADVVAAARGRFARLHLRTTNATAARLYERLGFRRTAAARDRTHSLDVD
jgi:ribosomal protein S18 acetylase RimI-like enzyme